MNNEDRAFELFAEGKYEEAVTAFDILIEANSSDTNLADIHCNRGYCQWQLKNFNEAVQDLLKCVTLNPDNYLAYIWLYLIFSDLDKSETAMEYWKRGKIAGGEDFHKAYEAITDNKSDFVISGTELLEM